MSRFRDTQLQVGENYSYLFNLRTSIRKSWMSKHTFRSQLLRFKRLIKWITNDYGRAGGLGVNLLKN